MLMTVVRPSPANTLIVDDRIVISTATAGLGPALESTPTCQRCAVLKILAWPVRSLRKTCGGGGRGGLGLSEKQHRFLITALMATVKDLPTFVHRAFLMTLPRFPAHAPAP